MFEVPKLEREVRQAVLNTDAAWQLSCGIHYLLSAGCFQQGEEGVPTRLDGCALSLKKASDLHMDCFPFASCERPLMAGLYPGRHSLPNNALWVRVWVCVDKKKRQKTSANSK